MYWMPASVKIVNTLFTEIIQTIFHFKMDRSKSSQFDKFWDLFPKLKCLILQNKQLFPYPVKKISAKKTNKNKNMKRY